MKYIYSINIRAELEDVGANIDGPGTSKVGDRVEFDGQFLFSELLQEVVESGSLDRFIRKRIESELYVMTGNDKVEYKSSWDWRLADDSNR